MNKQYPSLGELFQLSMRTILFLAMGLEMQLRMIKMHSAFIQKIDLFEEALKRYREIVPHLRLAGPTSFAPIIETAVSIVDNSHGQYHVLLIVADGQGRCL